MANTIKKQEKSPLKSFVTVQYVIEHEHLLNENHELQQNIKTMKRDDLKLKEEINKLRDDLFDAAKKYNTVKKELVSINKKYALNAEELKILREKQIKKDGGLDIIIDLGE